VTINGKSANKYTKKGSGVAGTKFVQLRQNLDKLYIGGGGTVNVKISQNEKSQITISGDDNLLSMFTIKQSGNILSIYSKGSIRTQLPLNMDVTIPKLSVLSLTNSATAYINDVNSKTLSLHVTGAGDIIVNSGHVESLVATISGAGDIEASELTAKKCKVLVEGAGDISVRCEEKVSGSVSGAGDINIYGNPAKRSVNSNGSGEVNYY
jgi:hypothetical protein